VRLKFLLRPGWVAVILLVVVFSSICFTVLAPWQFRRADETQARSTSIAESFNATPVPLAEVLPGAQHPDARVEWTQVRFTGQYVPEGETLAWQRTVLGEPAFEVLTPFRLDDGSMLLVNRGYVRPVQATHAPNYPAPPAGRVTVVSRIRADEVDRDQRPTFVRDGHRWSYAVDSNTVAQGTGLPLRPGYFALVDGQPGVLTSLPLPRLESGPYFSYALQWIAFGVMAPLAIGYLIYAELHPPDSAGGSGESSGHRGGRRRMSVAEAIAEEERQEQQAGRD
jgi:cytochrome oxidase assembly protein ShyY1